MENQTHYLKELLDYLNLNPNKFAKSIGIKHSATIYSILNYKIKINNSVANAIIGKYPRINKDWLLTGKGNMFNQTNSAPSEEKYTAPKTESFPKSVPYEFVKSLMDERVRTDNLQEELIRLHAVLIEKQLELFAIIAENQKEILEAIKSDKPGE